METFQPTVGPRASGSHSALAHRLRPRELVLADVLAALLFLLAILLMLAP